MSSGAGGTNWAAAPAAMADAGSARLAFWVAFPMILGLFSGWNQIGMIAPALPLAWSMIYWAVLSALMWAGLGAGTWFVSRVAPARTPLAAVLVGGAVLGVALTRPVHAAFQALFVPLTADPGAIATLPPVPMTLAAWGLLFSGNAMLMMFWVGGALFFARFLGYAPVRGALSGRVSGSVMPLATASPVLPSRFSARLSRLDPAAVQVIRADDHYTCAMTEGGEELVLYRFADAAAELEAAGWVRVHRSYCIRRDRIANVRPRGRSLEIAMQGGMIVPVSERYRAVVERLG